MRPTRVSPRALFLVSLSLVFAYGPKSAIGQTPSRVVTMQATMSWPGRCREADPLQSKRRPTWDSLPDFSDDGTFPSSEVCEDRARADASETIPEITDTSTLIQPVVPPAAKPDFRTEASAADQRLILQRGTEAAQIARARSAILEILRNGNACSSWLAKTDPNIIDTFSSLRFWVERDGPAHILKERDDQGNWIEHGPYIARTSQGTGADTSVAINANGAFFQQSSEVFKVEWLKGVEIETKLKQPLHVGPFDGATLQAQVITLLHELAHIVNAIPSDGLSPTGLNRSQENTELILDRCKRATKEGSKRILAGTAIADSLRVAAGN